MIKNNCFFTHYIYNIYHCPNHAAQVQGLFVGETVLELVNLVNSLEMDLSVNFTSFNKTKLAEKGPQVDV